MIDHVDDFCLCVYVVVDDMCQEQEVSRELRTTGPFEVAPSVPVLPGQASHPPPPNITFFFFSPSPPSQTGLFFHFKPPPAHAVRPQAPHQKGD